MVRDRITARDQSEDKGEDKRERGEEKHLERGHAEPARLDGIDHAFVFYARVHDQDPQVANRDRELPERHDRALH